MGPIGLKIDDIWKCRILLIQRQMVLVGSSQSPLGKHVAPFCDIAVH